MEPRFDGRVAVVTGGAQGIGRDVAVRIAAERGAVAILDTEARAGEGVAAEIDAAGGQAMAVDCDVSSESDVRNALAAVTERFSRLDLLVNNAGVTVTGTCVDTEIDAWQRSIAVNLTGTFLCSKHAIPLLLAGGGGAIVNVVTVGALLGVARRAPYIAAKAGVLGLTRSVAYDYSRRGIRCNAVCPATVRTAVVDELARSAPDAGAFVRHVSERQFVGRMAEISEVAAAILFLASDDASYMHGMCLPVDGGLVASSPRDHRIGQPIDQRDRTPWRTS